MNSPTTTQLSDLAMELSMPRCAGYLQRPIPCEVDEKVGAVLDLFAKSSGSERNRLARIFSSDQAFGLMTYAERMAILAVRIRSQNALKKGLLALVLEGFTCDMRESIMRLTLLSHSAHKIGVDMERLFEEVASSTNGDAERVLREFVGRSVEDKSIESMGYSEEMTSDGFSYSRNW